MTSPNPIKGSKYPGRKLTEPEISEVLRLRFGSSNARFREYVVYLVDTAIVSPQDIAIQIGVSAGTMTEILHRGRYEIDPTYQLPKYLEGKVRKHH
jgi:DNA-directed RNA polymerase specialized sigma24 family protein